MRVKLASQQTNIRLSKKEFQKLLDHSELSESTIFPNGKRLEFSVKLETEPFLDFDNDKVRVVLPDQLIRAHNPSKKGLSFHFPVEEDEDHHVVFEIDIKKPPLNAR